jgi:hypothetical protein
MRTYLLRGVWLLLLLVIALVRHLEGLKADRVRNDFRKCFGGLEELGSVRVVCSDCLGIRHEVIPRVTS